MSRTPPDGASTSAAPLHPDQHHFTSTDLGLLRMAVIWGVNFTVIKAGISVMPFMAFNAIRITVAAVVLMAVAFAVVGWRRLPNRRDTLMLLGLGVIRNGVYQLLFMAGLARTRAGIAALVIAAGPAWIAIMARLLGREHTTRLGWTAIALQMFGMLCVVAGTGLFDADLGAVAGAAYIMVGSIFWALFTVMLQPYTAKTEPLHLASLTLVSGAAVLLVAGWSDLRVLDLRALPMSAWGSVLYAGVGAMVIAYLLYYRGVRVLGPTRTAMYSNLQPVIALLVAWVVLQETPSVWQWTGGALVMTGLLLSRSAGARPRPLARSPLHAAAVTRS
jgi:drug/metabolite transporter (DMT)-like permease